MSTQPINPWAAIALTAIPEVAALIRAILELRRAYPDLSPEQIQALVADYTNNADKAFDAVLDRIAVDAGKKER